LPAGRILPPQVWHFGNGSSDRKSNRQPQCEHISGKITIVFLKPFSGYGHDKPSPAAYTERNASLMRVQRLLGLAI
jgi:hypothetical protein